MSLPDKKIVPFDADLGALLPAGKPDVQVSRLPYLRLAMPTSRFLYDQGSPIYALKPNLGDFIVAIGDDEYKVYPGDKGFLFLVAMTASQWKRIDRNGNQVGEPYDTQPEDLEWVPNPDRVGKKICIASASGDAKTADRYDRQMLVYALIEGLYPQLIYFAKTARPFGDWVANRAARWTIDGKPAPMIGLFRLTSEQTTTAKGITGICPSRASSPSSASPTARTSPGCAAPPSSAAHSRATMVSRSRIPTLSRPRSRRNRAFAAADAQGWFRHRSAARARTAAWPPPPDCYDGPDDEIPF